jgi:hypothetical protein
MRGLVVCGMGFLASPNPDARASKPGRPLIASSDIIVLLKHRIRACVFTGNGTDDKGKEQPRLNAHPKTIRMRLSIRVHVRLTLPLPRLQEAARQQPKVNWQ